MHDLIRDIAFTIGAAWVLGLLAQVLRQPTLLAYLVAGFLIGPKVLNWVHDYHSIEAISHLGLIFLLFMIGLEIDLKKIAAAGRSITVTAGVQILGSAVLAVFFFLACGFGLGDGKWDSLYLGIAAALSSTVIIVKVLYEKQELDTLTGRITLGVLVLQDLAAILFLAIQPNLGNLEFTVLMGSLLRVGVLVAGAMVISRYVLPVIFKGVARLPELVMVGALAWCFCMGEFGQWLGLSREMGALVAGVALSTFPYALDVTAKVTSLRDFFITLYFVALGMTIPVPTGSLVLWACIFGGFVVVVRVVTTFTPLFTMRQGLRTSLIPSINLSQVSEFSLVVLTLGAQAGHLRYKDEITGMAALAFAMLAAVSTFAMGKSDQISRGLIPWLKRAGLRDLDQRKDDLHAEGAEGHGHPQARILFLGFFRTASSLLEEMQRHAPNLIKETAVVDFSPVARAGLVARKVPVIYGDISQRDTLLHAGVEKAEILICTVPDALLKGINNERLTRLLRGLNPNAKIIATADVLAHASVLLEAGADYVSVARLREACDLLQAVVAASEGLIDEKRDALKALLDGRNEVLP